jgi:hypothetical protein
MWSDDSCEGQPMAVSKLVAKVKELLEKTDENSRGINSENL